MPIQKSSTKLLPHVTNGFDITNSPCGLRNHQLKLTRCRCRNHQWNCFHGWHVDSTTQKTPMASEIINENRVATASKIINETGSTGDAWIRQRKQPLLTQKSATKIKWCRLNNHQRNWFHGWHMDLTSQIALLSSEVTANAEIINETASTADTWIRQCKQLLWVQKSSTKTESLPTQKSSTGDTWIWQCKQPLWVQKSSKKTESLPTPKSSTKLLTRLMHGFESTHSRWQLRNHQRKLSRCKLRNHQRNCVQGRIMDLTPQTALMGSEIIKENWVAAFFEIISKTASTSEAWIRQRKQPMWAQKSSKKTKSLPTQKSSTKLLPRVTHGFDSANSLCWLRNHQQKLSRCRLNNHQRNWFHGWHMDLTSLTTPVGSKVAANA